MTGPEVNNPGVSNPETNGSDADHRAWLARAVTGPIVLITIGVLFAFDRFTEFRFTQTWPVLLIVIGLLKLLGGGRRTRYRDYPPQPGARP